MRGLRVAFLIAQLFLNGGASEEVDGRNDELAGAERASWRATACVYALMSPVHSIILCSLRLIGEWQGKA